MNCWKAQTLLAAFADGDLGAAELEAMTEHLEQCHDCSVRLNRIQLPLDLSAPELPVDDEDALWTRLDARISQGLSNSADRPYATLGTGWWYRLVQEDIALPRAVAVGYVAVALFLTGWALQGVQQSRHLQAELARTRVAVETLANHIGNANNPDGAFSTAEVNAADAPVPSTADTPNAFQPSSPNDPEFLPRVDGVKVVGETSVGPPQLR